MENLQALPALEAARLIAEGSISPVALVEACLAQIKAQDGEIAAWVHIDAEGARHIAREREAEVRGLRLRGPLHGVPVAIKDIIDVAGMTTTNGAKEFLHRRPGADALCIARLRAAGAIILGKVTTTECAYFEPAPTRNPWNLAHTPGGSSSGSAAAVAARMVPLALGTQTVGSVLRPAAFCGIVGFKGSFGAVPTDGVSVLARSLDHVGAFARKVADARLVFALMSGRTLARAASGPPRLALAPELLERAEPDMARQVQAAAQRLAAVGAQIEEIKLPPSFTGLHDAGRVILESEFAAEQETIFHDHAADYRPRTRALIEAGQGQKAIAYIKAQQARARFRDDMMALLASAGFLLSPVAMGTAPKGIASTGDPWFCAPWSTIGAPAVALPAALGANGLPQAIQLVAPCGEDAALLDAAEFCESVLGFDAVPGRIG